jgi:ubiquinone/menaquinone biosynthesis C-methylase UbiE
MTRYDLQINEKRLRDSRQFWNEQAAAFDDQPDHGLRDPIILETWTRLIKNILPSSAMTMLDIGCGTGSMSVILAGLGHKVTGIDLSPFMLSLAQKKAAELGHQIDFHVMDAAFPQFADRQFDVIICRHLLWALPEPECVLKRWSEFLKQNGRVILIEGFWGTGSGLHAKEVTEMLPPSFTNVSIMDLSADPNLWGRSVSDERYAIIADFNR